MYTSVRIFFYHGYILRDLSHQLLVTGSQLFIFQEHYHLLPLIYLPCIMVGTGSSIFSSLPNPSVISCPAPSVTLRNDGLCEGGRGITWGFFPPLTKGCPKGHQNWHFIQPDVGAQWVEIHLCVRCCWEMPRESETAQSTIVSPTLKSPVQKTEASFCHENHFCLKHQPEIIAYLLGIDSWVFFLNFSLFWQWQISR